MLIMKVNNVLVGIGGENNMSLASVIKNFRDGMYAMTDKNIDEIEINLPEEIYEQLQSELVFVDPMLKQFESPEMRFMGMKIRCVYKGNK